MHFQLVSPRPKMNKMLLSPQKYSFQEEVEKIVKLVKIEKPKLLIKSNKIQTSRNLKKRSPVGLVLRRWGMNPIWQSCRFRCSWPWWWIRRFP
jgi:hypothetical protein